MRHVDLGSARLGSTPLGSATGLSNEPAAPTRLRRLRRTAALRSLVRENAVAATDLILPIFVDETSDVPVPIEAMPGVSRVPLRGLEREVEAIARDGVRALMLFGVSGHKDAEGSDTLRADGHVHNDRTVENLARQAVIAAEAGADMVAPSAMMDGQIAAMRGALDRAGFEELPIMSYSSKFASAFYGPFRAAAGCDLKGDRMTYQADPMNGREALRESAIDEAEGADLLMVKPGMPYLDVLAQVRAQTRLPLGVYQTSGEYAMIRFAGLAGALDEERAVREALGAFKRAGADLILSYFTRDVLRAGL